MTLSTEESIVTVPILSKVKIPVQAHSIPTFDVMKNDGVIAPANALGGEHVNKIGERSGTHTWRYRGILQSR